MNGTPLYIVPGLAVLFWILVHAVFTSRAEWHRILIMVLVTVFLTAAGDLILGMVFGSETLSHQVVMLMAPAIIPLICLYFAHLYKDVKNRYVQVIWVVFPVILFTASAILAGINGLEETDAFMARLHEGCTGEDLFFNNTERAFHVWTVTIFRIIMAGEVLFMLVYCGILARKFHFSPKHLLYFLSKKRWRVRVLEIQVTLAILTLLCLCLKVFLHLPSSGALIVLVLVLSILHFLFGFFALFGSKEFISLSDIGTAFRFNYRKENASAAAEEIILDMMGQLSGESLAHVLTRLEVQSGASYGAEADNPSLSSAILGKIHLDDPMASHFQQLMMTERLFLQPGLSLNDVAQRLHTNKTYVSKMVNRTYNLGFPELVNILRIEYAEIYIRRHPDAPQEDIAKACGFISASSFNSTFKRITGLTPKVWAAKIQ